MDKNLELIDKFRQAPIELLEEKFKITPEELKDKFPGKKIFVCDFFVRDGHWQQKEYGYDIDGVTCIDHHIPVNEMEGMVSSTNLAIDYVKKNGPVSKDTVVVINHTDTDSLL